MDPAEFKRVRCDSCGLSTPSYDIVNSGSIEKGYRQLCGRCFNAEVAKWVGLEKFENLKFEPVVIADCTGTPHEFHFRTHLFGTGVAIDAFELRGDSPAGYQFQVIADPETDLLVLLGKLIEKIRRGLSTKYLIDGEFGRHVGDDQVVQGRITWDEAEDGRVPLLIIDGREISWDEFGRMLMSFEGFQFLLTRAKICEKPREDQHHRRCEVMAGRLYGIADMSMDVVITPAYLQPFTPLKSAVLTVGSSLRLSIPEIRERDLRLVSRTR